MQRYYRYYLLERPPMPGAFPNDFVKCRNFGDKLTVYATEDGLNVSDQFEAYGWVDYDHPLTAEQIKMYELREERPDGSNQ